MFERFTQHARDVITVARTEAEHTHSSFIGTEHLLIAMAAIGEGRAYEALLDFGVTADRARADAIRLIGQQTGALGDDDAAALKTIGIDLDAVVASVEQSFGPGALAAPQPKRRGGLFNRVPLTKRAKKVLELALREALALRHNYIGTEHLLLGVVREGEGLAAQILIGAGVDPAALRARIVAGTGAAAA
jgi:ATP-dependent Clp protease ATP-binding subunit ClpA